MCAQSVTTTSSEGRMCRKASYSDNGDGNNGDCSLDEGCGGTADAGIIVSVIVMYIRYILEHARLMSSMYLTLYAWKLNSLHNCSRGYYIGVVRMNEPQDIEPQDNVPQASAASGVGTKPVMLPELFTWEGDFVEWLDHFENVAAINSWGAKRKLLWLNVHLTGRAQTAFKRLPSNVRASYFESVKALIERFEPQSKRELYTTKFQARKRKKAEGWADFAQDLQV